MSEFINDFVYVLLAAFCYQAIAITIIYQVSTRNDFFCLAYGLDTAISLLSWIPWLVASWYAGKTGVLATVVAQVLMIYVFNFVHGQIIHKQKGDTVKDALNKVVGPLRNHLGLFVSLGAVPVFLILRFGEIVLYAPLRWILGFPKYKEEEWINISRQKIDGLVGHDMTWCLYCDWMTGVYSYGAEMLRNVESFWCPLKFQNGKKCENCKIDFPDIEKWAQADGTIQDLHDLVLEKYSSDMNEPNPWFGHESRSV
ncbi:MAG: hypothetical protein O3C63_01270 [Cyanobacteria bacterium]|nr:hypothetical protein [Cyanobacteriota bacterium]